MPLYGRGMRRRSVLAAALKVNDLLSRSRNEGIHRLESQIPAGRIVTRDETVALFPAVDRLGLNGAALWYDAVMLDSQRVIIEMLRWAVACGATTLNYVEAERLLVEKERVHGVVGRDTRTGRRFEYRAPVVVNCCGPWSGQVAERFDRSVPGLFRPSLALNVVLDIEPTFTTALAVTAKSRGARTYFLHPWKGRVLAGTYHAPWREGSEVSEPPVEEAVRFVAELRGAIPDLEISMDNVRRILSGLLPVKAAGSVRLAVREVILDHASLGGPDGLFSVSGVKFTTARRVAEKVLALVETKRGKPIPPSASAQPPQSEVPPPWPEFQQLVRDDIAKARGIAMKMVEKEAVLDISDLVLRRTDWGIDVAGADAVAEQILDLLPRGAIGRANAITASGGGSS
jgi:glycerol-3-phosphate dehydrogenase